MAAAAAGGRDGEVGLRGAVPAEVDVVPAGGGSGSRQGILRGGGGGPWLECRVGCSSHWPAASRLRLISCFQAGRGRGGTGATNHTTGTAELLLLLQASLASSPVCSSGPASCLGLPRPA